MELVASVTEVYWVITPEKGFFFIDTESKEGSNVAQQQESTDEDSGAQR